MIAWSTMGRVWIALAMTCLIGSGNAQAECRPTAILSGEPTLVFELAERLAASGIATTPADNCPLARVRVEQRGQQIRVEITDRFGRTGTREVRDAGTVATIVESWTSQEIEAGSLPSLAETSTPVAVVAAPAPWVYGLTAAIDSSAGSDGSIWMGGTVSSCARIGAVCVGGLVRAARDTRAIDASTIDHDSVALAALVTIGLPRKVGGFLITPGIGAGYGWQRLSEHHFDMVHMMSFDVDRSSHGLHADVHLDAAHRLGKHLSIYAGVRGDTAVVRSDSTTGPRSFVHAALGFRLGME